MISVYTKDAGLRGIQRYMLICNLSVPIIVVVIIMFWCSQETPCVVSAL